MANHHGWRLKIKGGRLCQREQRLLRAPPGVWVSLSRENSHVGIGRLVINARGVEALKAAHEELAEWTEVIAISGDVTAAEHRGGTRSRC